MPVAKHQTFSSAILHRASVPTPRPSPVGRNDNNECAVPYWQAMLDVLAHGSGDH